MNVDEEMCFMYMYTLCISKGICRLNQWECWEL